MTESYKDLVVWQKSMDLVEEVYLRTEQFPKEEKYGLSLQMRRAAVSIPSNIAEGSKRKDLPEYLQFLRVANASSAELETQAILAQRIYKIIDFSKSEKLLNEVQKMLTALISKLVQKNLSSKTYHLSPREGFTLIELLVAIGLFAVITSIAVGGFVNALRSQRQAAALLAANSNVSLAIEQMTREMRTGYNFCTTAPCPLRTQIVFTNARGEQVTYQLNNGAIERKAVPSGGGGLGFQPITADNVNVTHLEFYLAGNLANDGLQPRITIAIGVSPKEIYLGGNVINLQTSVSARLPLDS